LIYALVTALQDRDIGKVLMVAESFFHQDAEFEKDELLETVGIELFCFGVMYELCKLPPTRPVRVRIRGGNKCGQASVACPRQTRSAL
jgi:hypothetical protein